MALQCNVIIKIKIYKSSTPSGLKGGFKGEVEMNLRYFPMYSAFIWASSKQGEIAAHMMHDFLTRLSWRHIPLFIYWWVLVSLWLLHMCYSFFLCSFSCRHPWHPCTYSGKGYHRTSGVHCRLRLWTSFSRKKHISTIIIKQTWRTGIIVDISKTMHGFFEWGFIILIWQCLLGSKETRIILLKAIKILHNVWNTDRVAPLYLV